MLIFIIVASAVLIAVGFGGLMIGVHALSQGGLEGALFFIAGLFAATTGVWLIFDEGRRAGYFLGQVDAQRGKVTVQLVEQPNGEKHWESK